MLSQSFGLVYLLLVSHVAHKPFKLRLMLLSMTDSLMDREGEREGGRERASATSTLLGLLHLIRLLRKFV